MSLVTLVAAIIVAALLILPLIAGIICLCIGLSRKRKGLPKHKTLTALGAGLIIVPVSFGILSLLYFAVGVYSDEINAALNSFFNL